MLELLKLSASNFLSYKELDWKFNNPGLTLIRGVIKDSNVDADSNGSGKSTIPEMLTWGLYGQTLRDASADDVINYNVGKDCFVGLEFKKDENYYRIRRYRKHKQEQNRVYLDMRNETQDKWIDISASLNQETQDKIIDLVGMGYQVFVDTHMLGLASSGFFSSTDTQRKAILEHIVDADYSNQVRRAKEDLNELKFELVDLKESDEKLTKKIYQIEGSINIEKQRFSDLEIAEEDTESLIAGTMSQSDKERLDKSHKEVLFYKENSFDRKFKHDDLSLSIAHELKSQFENEIKDCQHKITRLGNEKSHFERDLRQAERVLSKKKENICESCGQDLPDVPTESDLDSLQIEINKCKEQIEVIPSVIYDCELVIQADEGHLDHVNFIVDMLSSNDGKANAVMELDRIRKEKIKIKASIDSLYKSLDMFQKKSSKINEMEDSLNEDIKYHDMLISIFNPSGPLKIYAVVKVLSILEDEVNKVLQSMKSDLNVKIDANSKGKIEARCYKGNGNGKFALASEGQKTRVNIAAGYGLRNLSSDQFNFVFLDDVFNDLDKSGVESLINVLKNFCGGSNYIFCVSPRQGEADHFSKIVTVEYEKGESKLCLS